MMNLATKILNTRGLLAGLTLFSGVALTSCMDDLETPQLPPSAYVSIYQGSPDAPAVNVYANGNLINRDPMNYSDVLAYNQFYTGRREFRVSPSNSVTSLLEKQFTLAADTVYSMFLVNESVDLDAVLVKDEWEDPISTKAQLRLVHISPDTENVYLEINDEATPLVGDLAYKAVSEFAEIATGNTVLKIKSSDTDEVLLTSGTLDMKGNRVYTLVLKGLKAETTGDKKLDIQLITNYIAY